MTARVLVGTCSWADKTLVECGRFYPPHVRTPEERLRYYAEHFPIVEVDSTYYGLPSERNAALWVERTPPEFTFDVKAFRLFTHHPTPVDALPKDIRQELPPRGDRPNLYVRDLPADLVDVLWQRFASALLPLDSAGKLGVVLLQFPPWFLPGAESREYLLEARHRLPQYRIAVEFRNGAWVNERNLERTLTFLRDHGLAFVCVDEPQTKNSVPPIAAVTADVAIVRFHGRNVANWLKRGSSAADRFDYLYREEELAEWVPRVRLLAEEAREVHLLMNNCHEDKAVRGARQLALLLEREGLLRR